MRSLLAGSGRRPRGSKTLGAWAEMPPQVSLFSLAENTKQVLCVPSEKVEGAPWGYSEGNRKLKSIQMKAG